MASIEADFAVDPIIQKLTTSSKVSIITVKTSPILKHVLCIHQPMWFKKDQPKVQALIDFDS